MTHATCRLTAKNRDQFLNPTLGNRVRATYTFLLLLRCCNLSNIGDRVYVRVSVRVIFSITWPAHFARPVFDRLQRRNNSHGLTFFSAQVALGTDLVCHFLMAVLVSSSHTADASAGDWKCQAICVS